MVTKIYLDMDGTLVDFVSQVNKYDFWRKDKANKVDWKKVKAMGPRFWSEMNWMPGAEKAFSKLQELESQKQIALYILSSIDFEDGRKGKSAWIKEKTNFPLEKVIFCLEPEDKAKWADKNSWLIDDRKKSLDPFAAASGNIINFTGDWNSTLEKVKFIIGEIK
jgi:5'(3')-deoxyribonucleotidase